MNWQGSKPCPKRIGAGPPAPVRFAFLGAERRVHGQRRLPVWEIRIDEPSVAPPIIPETEASRTYRAARIVASCAQWRNGLVGITASHVRRATALRAAFRKISK